MPLHNFRQVFLPYGFRKEETVKGRSEWVPFNRERSPIGCVVPHFKPTREDFTRAGYYAKRGTQVSEYAERKLEKMAKNIEKHMDDIAFDVDPTRTVFYLYDDGCLPDSDAESWEKYQLRLEALCLVGSTTVNTRRLKKVIEKLKGKA